MDERRGAAGTVLRATLFGTFRLDLPGGDEIEITGKRSRAVLAILCLAPGVAVERGRLCELLWQGRFQAQARASLRQTLLGLKKQLAPIRPDFLRVTRDSVAVNPDAVRSDLADLESALAQREQSHAREILLEIGAKPLLGRLRICSAVGRIRNMLGCSMPGGSVFPKRWPGNPTRKHGSASCRSSRSELMTHRVQSPRGCSTSWSPRWVRCRSCG
jgi:hypothetical protein